MRLRMLDFAGFPAIAEGKRELREWPMLVAAANHGPTSSIATSAGRAAACNFTLAAIMSYADFENEIIGQANVAARMRRGLAKRCLAVALQQWPDALPHDGSGEKYRKVIEGNTKRIVEASGVGFIDMLILAYIVTSIVQILLSLWMREDGRSKIRLFKKRKA